MQNYCMSMAVVMCVFLGSGGGGCNERTLDNNRHSELCDEHSLCNECKCWKRCCSHHMMQDEKIAAESKGREETVVS